MKPLDPVTFAVVALVIAAVAAAACYIPARRATTTDPLRPCATSSTYYFASAGAWS